MREGEVHSREMVVVDPALEDDECEIFGGDSGDEGGPEDLVERMAAACEAAESRDGQIIADGEDELAGQLRERHGGMVEGRRFFLWC